jgi:aryl-alcohol dehydrogenase-like predicted oxidoreductase
MTDTFLTATFGKTGPTVFRLGLSGTYRPGKKAIYEAIDRGVNFFFCYGFDTQLIGVLRDIMKTNREKFIIATGAYNFIWGQQNSLKTIEKRLKQLRTDYIDVFLFLGVMKEKEFPDKIKDQLCQLKAQGKAKTVGISTHDRKLAGKLMAEGELSAIMMRYNAAHRGAETDIFPHLAKHNPGVISYTATRWSYLTKRPKGWPKERPIPDAGMCYRFVLSNDNVDVCLTAPRNIKQLRDNLKSLELGPLSESEMQFMREFGDVVRNQKKYFM